MFSQIQTLQEDYFANISKNHNIEYIIPTTELLVNFRSNGLRVPNKCILYAEKIDYKGLLQLRLSDKCDHRKMYITTVDSISFHEIKREQALNVTFPGFIDNLIRLLQDCKSGKLEIHLVQLQTPENSNESQFASHTEPTDYQLQFVEVRPFKNLVHLCLPSRLAPLNVVLFYISSILDAMQMKTSSQEHSIEQIQRELQAQIRRNEQLNNENVKLKENISETARNLNKRHEEELQKLQESIRQTSEQRHTDNERNRKIISSLQSQIEKITSEKSNALAEKSYEHKRCESLNEELSTVKSNMAILNEQNERLHSDILTLKNTERKNEMHLEDAKKQIVELNEKFKKYDKAKADIIAELEAEKNITQTKRRALQIATEEISKANEIIVKQSQELIKLKKTISWRTEVALQQEKAILEKEKMLKIRNDEIEHLQHTIESLRIEIPKQLESMRKFSFELEKKYSEEINALKEKMKQVDKENYIPFSQAICNRRM